MQGHIRIEAFNYFYFFVVRGTCVCNDAFKQHGTHRNCWLSKIPYFIKKRLFIYFERERVQAREGQRGDTESQAGSALSAQRLMRDSKS